MTITQESINAGLLPFPLRWAKYIDSNPEGADEFVSLFAVGGLPPAGAVGSPGMSGTALSAPVGGCLSAPVPSSPLECRLAGVEYVASFISPALLVDRLWHNSGIVVTTTTAQTINSATLPARDINGSSNGSGVLAALEVVTATTNGSAISNINISYTNQDGTSGRTANCHYFPATAAIKTWVPFGLQSGDTGIRSIQSIALGTSLVTGAVSLVLFRPIWFGGDQGSDMGNKIAVRDCAIDAGLERIYDGNCLHPVVMSGEAGGTNWFRSHMAAWFSHVNPS